MKLVRVHRNPGFVSIGRPYTRHNIQRVQVRRYIGRHRWDEMGKPQRKAVSIYIPGLLITYYWGRGTYYGRRISDPGMQG
jgi:hypothetical protein